MLDNKRMLDLVGVIVAVGLLVMVGATTLMVMLWPIPKDNEILIGQIQGSLWTAFMMVVSFLYGTSVGRQKQDDTINKLAGTQPVQPSTKVTTTETIEETSRGSDRMGGQ